MLSKGAGGAGPGCATGKADRWAIVAQEAPQGGAIKGNNHAMAQWYGRTICTVSDGERWFCVEADPLAAGWRAPAIVKGSATLG